MCKSRLSLICVPVVFESALDSEGLRKKLRDQEWYTKYQAIFRRGLKARMQKQTTARLITLAAKKKITRTPTAVQQCRTTIISYLDYGGSGYMYKISTRVYEAMCKALYAL